MFNLKFARRVLGVCSACAHHVLGVCSSCARRVLIMCSACAHHVLGLVLHLAQQADSHLNHEKDEAAAVLLAKNQHVLLR